MTATEVVLREHGRVLEVCLDRPRRRNALSLELLRELKNAFETLDTGIRAVVLTSSGPVFTAGADFADLTGTSSDLEYDQASDAAFTAIRHCPVPVLAAVDGPCLGAGVELATSCDARIVGTDAWFRVPAVELGLLYNPSSIRRLHATLPRGTVTRLMVFAERFDAGDAVRGGLATHYTDGDPREQALALAETVAQLSPDAMAATRRLLGELDQGIYDDPKWQAVRVELLDSDTRRDAVSSAAQRHHAGAAPTPGCP
jgi:enoyl-CoA hydratase